MLGDPWSIYYGFTEVYGLKSLPYAFKSGLKTLHRGPWLQWKICMDL